MRGMILQYIIIPFLHSAFSREAVYNELGEKVLDLKWLISESDS